MVWSFGVVHHTGDTRRALSNLCAGVRPGGLLFLMVYGQPRFEHPEDFLELGSYQGLRLELRGLDFDQRIRTLREQYAEELVNAYFDAASPAINDLHRFEELAELLRVKGFAEMRRTVPSRNLFVTARREEQAG